MPIITIGLFVLLIFQFYLISQIPEEETRFDYVGDELTDVTDPVVDPTTPTTTPTTPPVDNTDSNIINTVDDETVTEGESTEETNPVVDPVTEVDPIE